MGVSASQHDHARPRHGQGCRNDPRKAASRLCGRASKWIAAGLSLLLGAASLSAEQIKIATFNTEVSRKGPGLLLRDIARGDDPQIKAVIDLLATQNADIVVLQDIDHDLENAALNALADRLSLRGVAYPHRFALRPNTGIRTGLDMDGDGRVGDARDAQGFGQFSGDGGMAILSRYPILREGLLDFSGLLWRDLPGAQLPRWSNGDPFPSAGAQAVQRLSSTGHWVVPIDAPGGPLTLLTFHATPPVFDGPEDRNGLRNNDEIGFWNLYLSGRLGPVPEERFVLLGDANNDPAGGEGLKPAIRDLLAHPGLSDPLSGQITVHWPEPVPGKMRVDYLLPSVDLEVLDAGIVFDPMASRHGFVWALVE